MKDVAGHGRTILFVSHNMASLSNLCTRGIYMHNGMLDFAGDIESCIQKYLHTSTRNGAGATERSSGSLIKDVRVSNPDGDLPENHIDPSKPVEIEIEIDLGEVEVKNPRIGIGINDQLGGRLATVGTFYNVCDIGTLSGKSSIRCSIPSLPLAPGEYPIKVALAVDTKDLDVSENDFRISVIEIDYYNNGKLPLSGHGSLLVRSVWSKLNIDRNN
jgi:lipopolysaccharide transport system ATP-binding protein